MIEIESGKLILLVIAVGVSCNELNMSACCCKAMYCDT